MQRPWFVLVIPECNSTGENDCVFISVSVPPGEMEFPALRLLTFLVLASVDVGVAVYYRYVGLNTQVYDSILVT